MSRYPLFYDLSFTYNLQLLFFLKYFKNLLFFLIYRLLFYDQNSNFGCNDIHEEEFKMDLPDDKVYADLNSDTVFPYISMYNVHKFLDQFEKKLGETAKDMYKETFLVYVRSTCNKDIYYLKSVCRAEMAKNTSYKIDLSFDTDRQVRESQCECAAGMGPYSHCKHVCTLLYAMTQFSVGHSLKVEKTCTERLQTFHHAKRYRGSPFKSKDLQMNGANFVCESDLDPRPVALRNMSCYVDHFRNVCLTTPRVSKLPIFQAFKPANVMALAHDHDYFKDTHEVHFLSCFGLKNVDKCLINHIEINTRAQAKSKLWAEERQKRLCSSSFGRILS